MASLSVIIPVLNEEKNLPLLLDDLAGQRGVELEVLVCDGGSRDQTCELVVERRGSFPAQLRLLTSPPGRGRQLNLGAAEASCDWFCFLHADSRLPEPEALSKAIDRLISHGAPDQLLAGHFRLHFAAGDHPSYRYYECKARQHRAGCVHGDQGLVLHRRCWEQVGPFRSDRPVMEDTELAEAVRQRGELVLLDHPIVTSIRRFESEGLFGRQMLNMLLLTCDAVGLEGFIDDAPGIYQSQDRSTPLQLYPFLQRLKQLRRGFDTLERLQFWYRIGTYVRNNAWQIPLWLRVRRLYRLGLDADALENRFLRRFDACFNPLTDHPPGRCLTGLLTWVWFRVFEWQQQRRFLAANGGGVEPPQASSPAS